MYLHIRLSLVFVTSTEHINHNNIIARTKRNDSTSHIDCASCIDRSRPTYMSNLKVVFNY